VRDKQVDVRVIAATNAQLREQIAAGEFREDLYYRLAVIPIELPPLRDRGDDALLLARRFLAVLAEEYGLEVPTLTREAVSAIRGHRWAGNVRELRNSIERALLLSAGDSIGPDDLALAETALDSGTQRSASIDSPDSLPFPASLADLETEAALRMVDYCQGNKSEAARRLGITRSRLYRILDRAE
jgi:DNA-binding NtrC family response regulator